MATRQSASRQSYGGSLLALENSSRFVPSGGTSGQVLTKNSGTDYDASWTTASSGGGGTVDGLFVPPSLYTSGSWYNRRSGTPAATSTSSGSMSMTSGLGHYLPGYMHEAVSINAVGIMNATTQSGTVRIGVYTANATTGLPDQLIGDFGQVAPGGTANTAYPITLATPVTLPLGFIWWCLAVNSGAAMSLNGSAGVVLSPIQGDNRNSFTYATMGGNTMPQVNWISIPQTVSAMPTTATGTMTKIYTSTTLADVWWKVA